MSYLIDTNIISEIRKGGHCDVNVARWYEAIEDASLYLSVMVIGEIRKGIEKLRPKNATQANMIEDWLEEVAKAFGDRILPIDGTVANEWGRLTAIRPLPVIDGLLAATAKVHGMTLVTRNIADIADLGVHVINPFTV